MTRHADLVVFASVTADALRPVCCPHGCPASVTPVAWVCALRAEQSRGSQQRTCRRTSAALLAGHQPPPEPPELPLPELPLPEPDDFFAPSVLPDGVAAHQRPPEVLRSLPLT